MGYEASLTKPGEPAQELEQSAHDRLEDAEALYRAGRYTSAIINGIYALEIRLKVVICHRLGVSQLPKVFQIHGLEALMLHTGLSLKIRQVKRPRLVAKNWDELLEISREIETARYRPNPKWDEKLASRVLSQLRDSPHGVLQWLDKQT